MAKDNNETIMQVKVRIEYLDALRGFVMLLVVLGHVPMYCYHHLSGISFSTIPSTFHLALFFFISGWFVNSKAVRNADATLRLRYDNVNLNDTRSYDNGNDKTRII